MTWLHQHRYQINQMLSYWLKKCCRVSFWEMVLPSPLDGQNFQRKRSYGPNPHSSICMFPCQRELGSLIPCSQLIMHNNALFHSVSQKNANLRSEPTLQFIKPCETNYPIITHFSVSSIASGGKTSTLLCCIFLFSRRWNSWTTN